MTKFGLDWDLYRGQQAQVYRNLLNGTMSVRVRINGNWLVRGHETQLVLKDVVFWVGESQRQKVIQQKQKNVHAWALGTLVAPEADVIAPICLFYDPYTTSTFVERGTRRQIHSCKYLVVRNNLVFCSVDAVPGLIEDKPKYQVWSQITLLMAAC